jgi:hypothetical protein
LLVVKADKALQDAGKGNSQLNPIEAAIKSHEINPDIRAEIEDEYKLLEPKRVKAFKKANCGHFCFLLFFLSWLLFVVALAYYFMGISSTLNIPSNLVSVVNTQATTMA